MSTGRPPSQLCGAFHGRTEAFCGSSVEQPATPATIAIKAKSQNHFAEKLMFRKPDAPG
jgi:hypothetical protein